MVPFLMTLNDPNPRFQVYAIICHWISETAKDTAIVAIENE